jgi:DNA-binding beta-propeller fold protein YncE
VISTNTNTVTKTIDLPGDGRGIVTAPSGQRAYVAMSGGTVSTIDVATDTLTSPTIVQASGSSRVLVTPDGQRLYISDSAGIDGQVGAYDTASGAPQGSVTLQSNPEAMGIVPDQPPTAKFSKTPGKAGAPTSFDGRGSSDSDGGSVAIYDWNFGDGSVLMNGGPTPKHVYARKGKYTATLTVTDNEGTSTTDVYTGRSMLRNGNSGAADSDTFNVPIFAFSATARRTQRVVRQRGIKITGGCTDVVCDATITGTITLGKKPRKSASRKLKLKRVRLTLAAGRKRSVKLKLSKRSLRKLRRALRQRRKARATIKLSLVDRAGDRASKTLRVRAKR